MVRQHGEKMEGGKHENEPWLSPPCETNTHPQKAGVLKKHPSKLLRTVPPLSVPAVRLELLQQDLVEPMEDRNAGGAGRETSEGERPEGRCERWRTLETRS